MISASQQHILGRADKGIGKIILYHHDPLRDRKKLELALKVKLS
jgi:hypothetical protein